MASVSKVANPMNKIRILASLCMLEKKTIGCIF